jgi:hypothetical protein
VSNRLLVTNGVTAGKPWRAAVAPETGTTVGSKLQHRFERKCFPLDAKETNFSY